jgi:hypothetical protein
VAADLNHTPSSSRAQVSCSTSETLALAWKAGREHVSGAAFQSSCQIYTDLGGDYFTQRDPERQTKRLVKQLERLGHSVTLNEVDTAPA